MKNKVINCDIAIYGSGIAAIFFLIPFLNTNKKIVIFESGSENQKTNMINTVDKIYGPIKFGLNNIERLGGFLGTAQAWEQKGIGGKLSKFEDKDFIDNKWPIRLTDLQKFYSSVLKDIKNLINIDLKEDFLIKNNFFNNIFSKKKYKIKYYSTTLSYKFRHLYKVLKKKIINSKNITLLYDHTLFNFNYNLKNKKINFAYVKNKNNTIFVESKNHIMATGCIETNRLFLNIFKKERALLHKYRIGHKITFHPSLNLGYFKFNKNLKKNKLLKSYNYYKKILIIKLKNFSKINHAIVVGVDERRKGNFFKRKLIDKFFGYIDKFNITLVFEHMANFRSRISLSKKKDKYGLNYINLYTFFSKQNLYSVNKIKEIYHKNLSKIKIFGSNFKIKKELIAYETNNHHHGGVLFGNQNKSPVDKNLRVKFLNNLHVVSSAVFPSSGIYGPTYTIIALAKRLANNLKGD